MYAPPPMSDRGDRLARSFLLASFEEFFADLERVRRAVISDPWGIRARDLDAHDRKELRQNAAHSVRKRLQALLEKQASEAGLRRGDHGARLYREAQYIMAALADELFLDLEWEGREAWGSDLLETRLFGTHVAGERIFQRIDQLLAERDLAYREIKVIYLLALSLGFQGMYRGGAIEEVERYRAALYDLVFPRQASVTRGERRLFPQSYMHTLDRSRPIRLPTIGRWASALAIVLGLYLAAAHLVWHGTTRDLREINAEIAEISR